MKLRIVACMLLACFLVAESVDAAIISIRNQEQRDRRGTIAFLDGQIVDGDANRLRIAIQDHDVRRLIIRSPGGLIREALIIGDLVRDFRLPVQAYDYCESACPIILLSSPERSMTKGTRIGFHSARNASGEAPSATIDFARMYAELGVTNDILGGLVTHRPQEMYYINKTQSKNLQIRVIGDINYVIYIIIASFLFLVSFFVLVFRHKIIRRAGRSGVGGVAPSRVTVVKSQMSPRSGSSPDGVQLARPLVANAGPSRSCVSCKRPLPGGRFTACPACGDTRSFIPAAAPGVSSDGKTG